MKMNITNKACTLSFSMQKKHVKKRVKALYPDKNLYIKPVKYVCCEVKEIINSRNDRTFSKMFYIKKNQSEILNEEVQNESIILL